MTPRKTAELLAVEALGYVAEDAERLGRFLALTGVSPATLRTAARAPEFLAAVLEYVVADEPLLVSFAEHCGRAPADVVRACAELRGPGWERDTA